MSETIYKVKTPDGSIMKIRGPEGVQDDQLLRVASGLWDQQRMANPTAGTGFLQQFREGMGKAFSDIGGGASQLVGMGPSGQEVQEQRQRDAPLMRTGGGIAGNVSGNIAAFAPLAVVPGANTVAGAGAAGATAAALQPSASPQERLFNMGVGGALGSGTQTLAGPIAQRLGERAAERQAALKLSQSQNVVRDETLRMGKEAGYVVPPSAVNNSWLERRLEGIGGKAAIGQEAALRNQSVTDRLAREAASLRPEQPLNFTNLRQSRYDLAAPHREIAALNPQAASYLEALQQARFDSKMAWKEYNRQGNRVAFDDATKAGANIKLLEKALEKQAADAGRPDLIEALKVSRQKIAQNRQVQNALNRGTGSVDASVIGRAYDNGAPLTGQLETIGRFQQAYRPYMREASGVPTPGVSATEALSSPVLGALTAGATGSPGGWMASGLPLVRGPMRSALLSKSVQDMATKPNYNAGSGVNAAAALNDPETRRRLSLMLRATTLPMIPEAVNQ